MNEKQPEEKLEYSSIYSGALKIIQTALNVTLLSFIAFCGYTLRSYFLNGTAIFALFGTILLLVFQVFGLMHKTANLPWLWIECIYTAIFGCLFILSSSLALTIFTRGYILVGIVGLCDSIAYFFDAIDKYKIAVTPRASYVWSSPEHGVEQI